MGVSSSSAAKPAAAAIQPAWRPITSNTKQLGGGPGHGLNIVRRFPGRHRDILGHRTEPRTVVRRGQIVVHRLGNVYGLHGETQLFRQLGDLVAGVGGIPAAVVEKIADVVRLEDLDQPFILGPVFLQPLELVAA